MFSLTSVFVVGLICTAAGYIAGKMVRAKKDSECRYSNPRYWKKHERQLVRANLRNAIEALEKMNCGINCWLDQLLTAIRDLQGTAGRQELQICGIRLGAFGSELIRIQKDNECFCFTRRHVIINPDSDTEQTRVRYGIQTKFAPDLYYTETGEPNRANLDVAVRERIKKYLQEVLTSLPA